MNERLKALRKTLGLTQEEMGQRLGVTKTAICSLESGRRNLTEQMAKSICREFRVSYYWLIDGDGDMFVAAPSSLIDEVAEEYGLDELEKKLLEKFLEIPHEYRQGLTDCLRKVFSE